MNTIDKKIMNEDWALKLMEDGVIVKCSISRWYGEISLSAEDLGLKFHGPESITFMKKYIKLGSEKIMPPEINAKFSKITSKIQKNLSIHCFNTMWGRFLPFSSFELWKEKHEKFKKEYLDLASNVVHEYDNIIAHIRSEYKTMAKDVWLRMNPNHPVAPENFIAEFVTKICTKVPSQLDLLGKYDCRETFYQIPLPYFIEKSRLIEKELRIEQDLKDYQYELKRHAEKVICQEYINRKKEMIDSFLNSTIVNLRNMIADLCEKIIVSIQRKDNKILSGDNNNIHKMIDKIAMLNFYHDEEIENLIAELRLEMLQSKFNQNATLIVSKLKTLSNIVQQDLQLEHLSLPTDYMEI